MEAGAGQNHPLVLFTFVLAILPTIQTQVRERQSDGPKRQKNLGLALATQFCGNLQKDKEEKK